jgi:hypothetical protein
MKSPKKVAFNLRPEARSRVSVRLRPRETVHIKERVLAEASWQDRARSIGGLG